MNTDRTFDPAQQGDMNATRRINVVLPAERQ